MIREVAIETVSVEEAIEMAYDGKVIDAEETENGFLCTILQEVNESAKVMIKQKNEFVVCCETSTGTLYLAKKGTTFYLSEAKRFKEKDVKTKVFFMNKKGNYNWKYLKV